MPFERIAAVVAAYVVMSVLLLSLNIASRWRWWVKAGAIVVCGLFFVGSYVSIYSLLGWPATARVPDRFSLIATRVVEPSKALGDSGAIYLWLETLDEDNVPSNQPLSYRISYTDELARTVSDAQARLDQGEDVEASLQEIGKHPTQGDSEGAEQQVGGLIPDGAGGDAADYLPGANLVFGDMPPVRLPNKGPL